MDTNAKALIAKAVFSGALLLCAFLLLGPESTSQPLPKKPIPARHNTTTTQSSRSTEELLSESSPIPRTNRHPTDRKSAEARFWSWGEVVERLKQNPSDSMLNLELGLILMEQKNNPLQAIRFFETALQVNPANQKAAAALVEAYAKANRLDDGLRFIDRCIEANPSQRAELLTAKADLQYQQAEFFAAKQSLEEALAINPHDENISGLLGLIYTTLGDERGMFFLEETQAVEHRMIFISRLIERAEWAEAERLLQSLPQNTSKTHLLRYLEESRAEAFLN